MSVSETSMQAYYSIQKCSAERCLQVRQYIEANPNVTNEDIAQALGMRIQGVTPRTRELKVNGLIWITGRARTSTGRTAFTMRAATCPHCLSTKLEATPETTNTVSYYCYTCGKRFMARTGGEKSEIVEVIG